MFPILIAALLVVSTIAAPLTLRPSPHQEDTRTTSFYLNVRYPNRPTFAPEYLISSGLVAPTVESASAFQLTGYGGLATVSTDDKFVTLYLGQGQDDPAQPWYMSPSLLGVYTGVRLETTEKGEILRWEDRRFQNERATFCESASGIEVVFWGPPPDDCEPIDLIAARIR